MTDCSKVAKSLNYQSLDTMLAHLGSGDLKPQKVMLRLRHGGQALTSRKELRRFKRQGHQATGECRITAASRWRSLHASPMLPRPARDPIVGYVTRGRGLTVHRPDCHNLRAILSKDGSRVIACRWSCPEGQMQARIEVISATASAYCTR